MSRDAEVRSKTYSEKLRDPRWQKVRLRVLERDDWHCQDCFDGESTLHVHHLYYEQNRDPWDYPLDAFVTLCESCHEVETTHRLSAERALVRALRAKGFLSIDIEEVAEGIAALPELPHIREVTATAWSWAFSDQVFQDYLIDRYFKHLDVKARRRDSLHSDTTSTLPN